MKATMSLLNKSFIKRNIYQGLPCHIDPLKVRSEVEAALMFLILNLIQQKKKKKQRYFDQDRFFFFKRLPGTNKIYLLVLYYMWSFLDITVERLKWIYCSLYKLIIVEVDVSDIFWYGWLLGSHGHLENWLFKRKIILKEYFGRTQVQSEFFPLSNFRVILFLSSSFWLLHSCFLSSLY